MDRKFGRKKANREHMIRNLVTSLILYERIETTLPRAKEVKSEIDRLISDAKKDDLNSHKKMLSYLFDVNAAKKIKEVLNPRYQNRNSGFTRLFQTKPRLGDGAPMAILELIPETVKPTTEKVKKEESKKTKK